MKIPKPGVDLFLPFFWSSRLRFSVFRGESCYSGPVPYTGLSLFLPTGLQNVTYQTTLFSISPFPYRTTWTFSLTVFSTGVGSEVRFADDVIWFFFHTISVCWIPSWRGLNLNVAFWTHFSSYFPPIVCSFFCISRWWLISQRWIIVFLARDDR